MILASVSCLLSLPPTTSLILSVTPTGDLVCLSDPSLCSRQPINLSEPATVFVELTPWQTALRRLSSSSDPAPLFGSLLSFLLFCLALLVSGGLLLWLLCRRLSLGFSTHRPLDREGREGEEGRERGSETMLYETYPHPEEDQAIGDEAPEQRRPTSGKRTTLPPQLVELEERRRSAEKALSHESRPYRRTLNPLTSPCSTPPPTKVPMTEGNTSSSSLPSCFLSSLLSKAPLVPQAPRSRARGHRAGSATRMSLTLTDEAELVPNQSQGHLIPRPLSSQREVSVTATSAPLVSHLPLSPPSSRHRASLLAE
jgi:hypothetical protein